MTKTEVIMRFCALAAKVAENYDWQEAADCLCEHANNPGAFNFSEKVMAHIEEAVQRSLEGAVEIRDGATVYYNKDGLIHRDNDMPAYINHHDGGRSWWKDGELHRDGDKPAIIYANGTQKYYQHGELHRDGDKPAAIYPDGTEKYYQHGELHRDGDKPAEMYLDGTLKWYQHGRLSRENGKPTVVRNTFPHITEV